MRVIRENFIPSIIVSVLLGILALGLNLLGVSSQLTLIIAGIILVITFTITLIVYRPLRRILALRFAEAEISANGQDPGFLNFRSQLTKALGTSSQAELMLNCGVTGWFPSLRDAESEIMNQIQSAREIKILTNNGKWDLAKGTRLYDVLISNRHAKIRILLASPSSYFVSPDWARSHKINADQSVQWVKRIRETIEDIQYIGTKHSIDIDYRLHNLPWVWHIWIIDETAFVSAWLERTNNAASTKVIEIKKDNQTAGKHLYDMFSTFYERIWNEFSEEH